MFILIKSNIWGKKEEKEGIYYWLPLEQHLLDTGNIMIMLWNHWLSEGQRILILQSISSFVLDEAAGQKLVLFLGYVHDIGKATPCFSLRRMSNNSIDLDKHVIDKLRKAGFQEIDSWSGELSSKSHHALAGQVLVTSFGVGEDIASIIGGHHGKTANDKMEIKTQLGSYAFNYYDCQNQDSQRWKDLQRELFEWALKEAGYQNVDELPKISQPAQVLLQGLLIMADWIASNEEYFPLFPIDKDEEENQEQRLKNGWEKWSKTYIWTPEYFFDIGNQYYKRFGFYPREVQKAFSHAIDKAESTGIFILEASMGIGKTEAALIAVEQMAEKSKCAGAFFALPTQATSDGIFERIKNWAVKVALETGDDKSIQLVHGKAQFNDSFKKIKNSENIDIEDAHGSVVVNNWFTGRKTAILDDFVVGTIDQLLLAGLKQRHLSLRHLGLSKKVVVIDEVHAFDAYMGEYLFRVIEWLGAYHIPVIILSATLPSARREKLIRSYLKGRGIKKRNTYEAYSDWDSSQCYPLITYTDGHNICQVRNLTIENRKEVNVNFLKDEDLAYTIKKALSKGGVAGIIVNTVKRAQALAFELESAFGKENISVIHSSFLAPDRSKKEKQLLNEIGKDANRPKIKVIIGTQVLEQSLDIDFDILFTDIAPMDLLLQRIGRLHRFSKTKRPHNLSIPNVYIMGIQGEAKFEKGAVSIYGDYLLIRTQLFLPQKLVFPTDISHLVQRVYSEDNENDISLSIYEKYQKAKELNILKTQRKEINANAYRLDSPYKPFKNSLIGWLRDPESDTEERGLARVRDGTASIEVILVKRKVGGLYLLDNITRVDGELNSFVSKKISQQTVRLPHIFCYNTDEVIAELEELNKQELSHWQNDSWLKGSLGMILEEDSCCVLSDYKITYDKQYGLMYEKEGE